MFHIYLCIYYSIFTSNINWKRIFIYNNCRKRNCKRCKQCETSESEQYYELPDGQVIIVGSERFRAPETLFQPNFIGLEQEGVEKLTFKSIIWMWCWY